MRIRPAVCSALLAALWVGGTDATPAVGQATADAVAPGPGEGSDSPSGGPVTQVPARFLNPCPQEKIARLLGSALTPSEISRGLALEHEVLVMCAARQRLALEVLALERLIRGALPAPEVVEKIVEVEVEKIVEVERIVEVPIGPGSSVPSASAADMSWFSIYGTQAAPRAGVVLGDGTRLFVGVGDEVPGVGRVTAIQAVPPEVRVEGATLNPLPQASAAPAGRE